MASHPHVERELEEGRLWPDPPLQLNPAFESGGYVDDLIGDGVLHPECGKVFRTGKLPDRITLRELGPVLAESYGGALERGDLLALAGAVDRLLRRIAHAAVAAERAGPPYGRWGAVAGVLRDLVRELAAALDALDGPVHARDPRVCRMRVLDEEGRRLMRDARRQAVCGPPDPAAAIKSLDVVRAFERALSAARDAGDMIGRVVAKHA